MNYKSFYNFVRGRSFEYCDHKDKKSFHLRGKNFLRKLAADLGYHKSQYEIRSCVGGIAVSGEVILHTENLYVQIRKSFIGNGFQIMFRACNGMNDYTGKTNHYVGLGEFVSSPQSKIEYMKQIAITGK